MSSIYKKGRDGYFYYQTYQYNKKTGKNDKRVYHALGTKNFEKAKIEQQKLDDHYSLKSSTGSRNKRVLFYLAILPLAFILFFYSSKNRSKNQKIEDTVLFTNVTDMEKTNIDNRSLKNLIENQDLPETKPEQDIKEILNVDFANKNIDSINYKIHNIEKISGVFDQGKISLTINNSYSEKQLFDLCCKVRLQYNQFNNIIICIYDDSPLGTKLASDGISNATGLELSKAWLAMYTYNSVEGTYFDDDPSGYLKGL